MRTLLLALTLASFPRAAHAHDFWLERSGDAYVLRYGHRGGETLAIDAAKVKAIRCVESGAAARDVRDDSVFTATEAKVTARCAAISAFNDGGYYSLTPDGEKNLPKNQVPDAVKSWASRQFAKWVDASSPAAEAPVGDELEIVPVTDLVKTKVGDKIAVRVLFQGKPAPGAVVAVDHRPIGETDSDGVTRLRLKNPGVQSLTTSLRRPLGTAEADALVLEASLTFEVVR
jgi:nickel transport protein